MQHSAYVWHPLHCRWQRTHSITPNHSVYDVTSTSGRTMQPLYQTLNPLYLCHLSVSTDISPTFVWHHTHLLCEIIWTIYNITPNPYVITFLYLWHHSLHIWNRIQYLGNIYTYHVTLQPLSVSSNPLYRLHHTHSFMTSHWPYVWHRLHYTRHHSLTFWPHTTIWRTSHPLY